MDTSLATRGFGGAGVFEFTGIWMDAGRSVWALICAIGRNENASREVKTKSEGKFIAKPEAPKLRQEYAAYRD
jgi:hypothetical protein